MWLPSVSLARYMATSASRMSSAPDTVESSANVMPMLASTKASLPSME